MFFSFFQKPPLCLVVFYGEYQRILIHDDCGHVIDGGTMPDVCPHCGKPSEEYSRAEWIRDVARPVVQKASDDGEIIDSFWELRDGRRIPIEISP